MGLPEPKRGTAFAPESRAKAGARRSQQAVRYESLDLGATAIAIGDLVESRPGLVVLVAVLIVAGCPVVVTAGLQTRRVIRHTEAPRRRGNVLRELSQMK